MKTHQSHSWKGGVVAVVVLLGLVFSVQAFGTATDSQDVTLSATVREPSGTSGTVAFTFELEEMPAISAVLPNYSTLPPQPSTVPEASTLALVGLGVLGLMGLRRTMIAR